MMRKDIVDLSECKINSRSGKLGAVNLNNMIPIPENEYIYANININYALSDSERKYRILLNNQLRWLNRHGINLRHKAKKLYENRTKNTIPVRIKDRCCDFQLLEEKCLAYSIAEDMRIHG